MAKHLCTALAASLLTASALCAQPYTLPSGQTVAPLDSFQDCDVCPEMIVLPQETFKMGAEPWEAGPVSGYVNTKAEGPVHRVQMDLHLAMGRNEVTYDDWMACVAGGGCSHTPPTEIKYSINPVEVTGRNPVLRVSYLDIREYVDWLNGIVGAPVYRLPTEAEWEFAARAGTTTRFAQGDRLTPEQAAYSEDATARSEGRPEPSYESALLDLRPVPVDALDAAKGWGLRHMSGNAVEMTMSCWSERHLGLATASAYLAEANTRDSCRRVTKGGSFMINMFMARPGGRGSIPKDRRLKMVGFRLVREMQSREGDRP